MTSLVFAFILNSNILHLKYFITVHYSIGSVAAWKGPEPLVLSGSSDGTIKVWNTQNGSVVATCEGHHRDVWAVTVTQRPRQKIVSASFDRTVRMWDPHAVMSHWRWNRRKSFLIFLYGSGFHGLRGNSIHGDIQHDTSLVNTNNTPEDLQHLESTM